MVAIVTLNWNRPADTIECLDSAAAQSYPNTELVVVDNGSSDDSVAQIRAAFPAAHLVETGKNLGFAGGCNRGIREALARGAEFVFLINNDTTFTPDCVEHLVAQTQGDVGMTIPAIYYTSAPTTIWSLGGIRHRWTWEKTDDTDAALKRAQHNGTLERDYVPGCGLLLRRDVLEQVGLFDETFFMYYEDMDFSWRVRAAGFRILLVPAAQMWHKVSVSSGGSNSPNERYWMARSSVLFFRKYVHGARWLIVAPYRTASAIKTVVRLLRNRRPTAARAYLRGLRDGLHQ